MVEANITGVAFLFKKNKIDALHGTGTIAGPGKSGSPSPTAASSGRSEGIVIATGSEFAPLPGVEVDEKRIVTSTGALALPRCRSS